MDSLIWHKAEQWLTQHTVHFQPIQLVERNFILGLFTVTQVLQTAGIQYKANTIHRKLCHLALPTNVCGLVQFCYSYHKNISLLTETNLWLISAQ